jgi:hypothetical protein
LNTCCPADHPQGCGRVCCLASDVCSAATSTCCPSGSTPCGTQCCTNSGCDVGAGQCCPPGVSTCGTCGSQGQQCCHPGNTCGGAGCSQSSNTCVGCSQTSNTCVTCPTQQTQTLVNRVEHVNPSWVGNDSWFICQRGQDGVGECFPSGGNIFGPGRPPGAVACDPGFIQGTCTATQTSVANGSACSAQWADAQNCSCQVHIQTPSDLSKSVDCTVLVTEVPVGCP